MGAIGTHEAIFMKHRDFLFLIEKSICDNFRVDPFTFSTFGRSLYGRTTLCVVATPK